MVRRTDGGGRGSSVQSDAARSAAALLSEWDSPAAVLIADRGWRAVAPPNRAMLCHFCLPEP